MEKHFALSDEAFEQQFSTGQLDPSIFSHEAHLRLAWIHLQKYGLKQARTNIQKQLRAFVVRQGALDKYHQTLTIAAIQAVHHFMGKGKSDNFAHFIMKFPELKNNFKELINSHYSFDIFNSDQAKLAFVAPDLEPF